jgi:ABC-type phosphate/phosphonate transport system substrate-binding protein
MNRIASLPWYDLREVRSATNALWRELARQFRMAGLSHVPQRLNRNVAYERQWTTSDFFFGQACGYDVRMAYADHLQVVATPCYNAPGCEGSNYSSFVVVRADSPFEFIEQLRGTRCVINTPTSHSGMNVLRALVAPLHCDGRFFSEVQMSGSHERSLRMIQRSEVDVAAIDCVTYGLLAAYRCREIQGTRVLHRTALAASPPYVTGSSTSAETLAVIRQAVLRAMAHPSLAAVKSKLLISGIEVLPDEAYGSIESLAVMAHHHNYREIPDRVLAAG